MKASRIITGALVCALLLAAVLPVSAASRTVAPSADILAFFEERGVDPQYVARAKSEVPAEQWRLITKIVNTPDDADVTTDDHDVLNSLVSMSLYNASAEDETVSMSIGNIVWSVVVDAE